ncbi:MAG: hypothetical protein O4965_07025 [Trichodesmium sp. St19_bin1]|nr:hypothetical protein [Trichodesmium sp. St19_bin1]
MFNSLLLAVLLSFSPNTNKESFDINQSKLECQQEFTLRNNNIANSLCIQSIEKLSEKKYKIIYKIIYNNNNESTVDLRTNGNQVKAYYYDLLEDDFLGSEEGTVIYNEKGLKINLPNYSLSVQIK